VNFEELWHYPPTRAKDSWPFRYALNKGKERSFIANAENVVY